jgi:hypothetical protein
MSHISVSCNAFQSLREEIQNLANQEICQNHRQFDVETHEGERKKIGHA